MNSSQIAKLDPLRSSFDTIDEIGTLDDEIGRRRRSSRRRKKPTRRRRFSRRGKSSSRRRSRTSSRGRGRVSTRKVARQARNTARDVRTAARRARNTVKDVRRNIRKVKNTISDVRKITRNPAVLAAVGATATIVPAGSVVAGVATVGLAAAEGVMLVADSKVGKAIGKHVGSAVKHVGPAARLVGGIFSGKQRTKNRARRARRLARKILKRSKPRKRWIRRFKRLVRKGVGEHKGSILKAMKKLGMKASSKTKRRTVRKKSRRPSFRRTTKRMRTKRSAAKSKRWMKKRRLKRRRRVAAKRKVARKRPRTRRPNAAVLRAAKRLKARRAATKRPTRKAAAKRELQLGVKQVAKMIAPMMIAADRGSKQAIADLAATQVLASPDGISNQLQVKEARVSSLAAKRVLKSQGALKEAFMAEAFELARKIAAEANRRSPPPPEAEARNRKVQAEVKRVTAQANTALRAATKRKALIPGVRVDLRRRVKSGVWKQVPKGAASYLVDSGGMTRKGSWA